MTTTLYYFHDPMCSWCWGFRPVWVALVSQLPASVSVEYVLGGLASDCDEPMRESTQRMVRDNWRKIHALLGTEFNDDFWCINIPRRSTYPACRAVIAADNQGAHDAMVLAIQQAYYRRALNPSDECILKQLAEELGLDVALFVSDLHSNRVEGVLQQQIAMARSWPIKGFPSLVLFHHGVPHPLTVNYQDATPMLLDIDRVVTN